jgi:DMSO/TMAO reductase YedYZ molybdopterin-dependent catalytic subunit
MHYDSRMPLTLEGAVDAPRAFSFADLAALPEQVADVAQLVPGRAGGAVRLSALLDAVGARGPFLLLTSSDGFSISLPVAAVRDALIVYRLADGELPAKQGGPVRFLVPRALECDTGPVDACANVKSLASIRVTDALAPDTHRH